MSNKDAAPIQSAELANLPWQGMMLALADHIENHLGFPPIRWGVVGTVLVKAARDMLESAAVPAIPAQVQQPSDEQIEAEARKYAVFVSGGGSYLEGNYNILQYDCREDFFNCVRACATLFTATPAQPIAPPITPKHIEEIKDMLLWPVTEDDARAARDMLQSLHFDVSMAEQAAQPIADVSAPTDPMLTLIAIWEARAKEAHPSDAMLINKHIRELKEANVSAPTDDENYDALRAAIIAELKTHRMVHLYEMEDDGPGAKYPLVDRLSLDGGTIGSGSDEIEAIADAVLDVVAARAAAPVSGLGASIERFTIPHITSRGDVFYLASDIDSRPRSEDSREFTDALRKAFITLEGVGNIGRNIVLKFNQRADAYTVHDYLLKVSALASTTPPKADNA